VATKKAPATPPARRVGKAQQLTPKQTAFIHAYLETGNASEAYRKAYDASAMSAGSLRKEAGRLLEHLRIAPVVAAEREKLAAQHGVSAEMVIRELRRIATADIRKIVEWSGREVREEQKNGKVVVRGANDVLLRGSDEIDADTAAAIAEVVQTKDGLRIKFHDKVAALDKLARHLGLMDDTHEPGSITVQILNFATTPQQVPTLERKQAPTIERMRALQRGRGNG
jgi:phage terminase small subunit